MASTAQQLTMLEGEYELCVLDWITRRICFFNEKLYQILFCLINLENFSRQNWLVYSKADYTLREKIFVISSNNKTV